MLGTLGVELSFDPAFLYPEEQNEVESFFTLTGWEDASCDFCRAKVPRNGGYYLSPWIFRYNATNGEFGILAYGGGESGRLRFLRDWSHWLLCDQCTDRFTENLPGRPQKVPS